MSKLFLHPPFDAPDVLATILPDGVAGARPMILADHAAVSDGGVRVALVARPGADTAGLLVDLGPEDRARLDFAMAAIGAHPVPVSGAEAYLFAEAPEPAGESGEPAAEARQWLIEALSEAMDHYGHRAPSEMPFLMHGISIRALGRARGPETRIPQTLGSGLGRGDVEVVRSIRPYAHYFGMEEHRLRHRRFDGAQSDTLERAVFTSGDAVTVLPYDPGRGTVLLIEQFRAGPFARRDPRCWCLETVAGRCDRAEPPEETARREAAEEAGLTLGRLERVTGFYPSPGIMSEYIVAFVGEADLGAAGGTHGLPEENEDIRSVVVPLDAALAAVRSGEINNAPLLISLLWLRQEADRLRDAWR